jgi:hypothetical protein
VVSRWVGHSDGVTIFYKVRAHLFSINKWIPRFTYLFKVTWASEGILEEVGGECQRKELH